MRDANYGLQAIEHRFKALGGTDDELYIVDDKSKTDLSTPVLIAIYGLGYVGHPRLLQNYLKRMAFRDETSCLDPRKQQHSKMRSSLHSIDQHSGKWMSWLILLNVLTPAT